MQQPWSWRKNIPIKLIFYFTHLMVLLLASVTKNWMHRESRCARALQNANCDLHVWALWKFKSISNDRKFMIYNYWNYYLCVFFFFFDLFTHRTHVNRVKQTQSRQWNSCAGHFVVRAIPSHSFGFRTNYRNCNVHLICLLFRDFCVKIIGNTQSAHGYAT